MDLSAFCNSCHAEFSMDSEVWRFAKEGEPPVQDVPHFCRRCAIRVGLGVMVKVRDSASAERRS